MVVRYFCRCLTCGHAHTLRISMGHGPTQQHTFACGKCAQDMSIEVVQQPEIASCEIKCTTNCRDGTEEGLIVNLHPDFPIPEDQLHVDQAFPWLSRVAAVGKRQESLGLRGPQPSSVQDMQKWRSEIQTHPQQWAILRKSWSLARSGKEDLALTELNRYKFHRPDASHRLADALFDFCGTLLQSKVMLYVGAEETMRACSRQYPQEFARLKQWYSSACASDHLDRYFDIFSQFFQDFAEFSQTLLLYQYGLPLSASDVASSQAFARAKMFYGNSFEALTSNFVLLAALNNVFSTRAFDQFEKMDMKKYVTINKARRGEAFSETAPFAAFAEGLDSGLRNASHHGAIKLDPTRRHILIRSGGTGADRRMRYIEYLFLCCDIFIKLAALFMLELLLVWQ
jgi:hypothetical protein